MFKWPAFLVFLIFFQTLAYAEEISVLRPLHIGLEKNDRPYSFIDKKNAVDGILIDTVNSICNKLNRKCKYSSDKHFNLIGKLKTQKIDVLLITNQIVIPKIDEVLITPPICKINPIYVQKSTDETYFQRPADLALKEIGVKQGSSLHISLKESYSSSVNVKTYHMMESAIFDLVFGRIDGIFVGEAFYQDKIYNSPLGNVESDIQLIATKVNGVSLAYETMSLAVSIKNKKLYDKIVTIMQESRKNIRNCSGLLNKNLSIIY